jgi:hypothetical protein
MTRFLFPILLDASRGRHVAVMAMVAAGLAALMFLSGCAGLQPLPVDARHAAHGSWLRLQYVMQAEVSPGVHVELPDAPYRARFADQNGIYYQASRPVVYRTVHGVYTAVEGGLFVRFDQPTVAVVWTEPLWGAATLTYPQTFLVQRFAPALNGSAP